MFETRIKVKKAAKKIRFCEFRLAKFYKWDAPEEYQNRKERCITMLHDRIRFLQKNASTFD
jgi:hypothetical protein